MLLLKIAKLFSFCLHSNILFLVNGASRLIQHDYNETGMESPNLWRGKVVELGV